MYQVSRLPLLTALCTSSATTCALYQLDVGTFLLNVPPAPRFSLYQHRNRVMPRPLLCIQRSFMHISALSPLSLAPCSCHVAHHTRSRYFLALFSLLCYVNFNLLYSINGIAVIHPLIVLSFLSGRACMYSPTNLNT